MKFWYKQTGIVVESDEMLDSTMFRPVEKESEPKEEPKNVVVNKTTATRKTTVAKKR